MKDRGLKMIYWVILAAIAGCLILQLSSEEFDTIRPIEGDGTYLIHSEAYIPREDADIMIVGDGKIHLFYIENELVNVYTTSGEFLHGLQFPDYQNGISDMAFHQGLLYVDARLSGIYVFDGTELIRFELQHTQNKGHDELEEMFDGEYPHTDGEYLYTYVAENNKVIRSGNGITEDVLRFPRKSPHMNALLLLFGFFVLAGCEYERIRGLFRSS